MSDQSIPDGFYELVEQIQKKYKALDADKVLADLDKIILHPNHSIIYSVPGNGYYRKDIQQYTRGVLSMTPYDMELENKRPSTILKRARRTCFQSGKEHGSLVHSQLESCCEIISGYLDMQYGVCKMGTIDPCVVRCLNMLNENNMIPIYTELLVFDPISIYGTAIDMIAYDIKRKFYVAIEIKTVSIFLLFYF